GIERHAHGSPLSVPVVLSADALVAVGLALTLVVFKAKPFPGSRVTIEPGQHVVTAGPYAIVRHPMYSASVLWFLATPFALGSPSALVRASLLSLTLAVRLVDEERYRGASLPGYDGYCRTVRWRLIPGLW